jgi:hypothetical protein
MANPDVDCQMPEAHDSSNVEICVPSTPPPTSSRATRSPARGQTVQDRPAFTSPPPPSGSMTPPPSVQHARPQSPNARPTSRQNGSFPASPPTTVRTYAAGSLPTPEYIAKAGIEELRSIAQDLLLAVRDARMSAAHFKLQHNLLTIESQESAQRAEVEHQMTRREVEVLHAAEYRHRASKSVTPRASQPPVQPQIDTLSRRCADLQADNEDLERRLRRAKKLIENEKDRSDLLLEENLLLKKRIRENREHFTRMKSQSPLYATPRNDFATPSRKSVPPFPDSAPPRGNIAALLAADQVLSEAASVPSTPTKLHSSKLQGHTRGAHSLSSLQSTPARSRLATTDALFYTNPRLSYAVPLSQPMPESAERDRHDRDSTISITDDEEAITDEELPPSQASSLATNMLRRNPGGQASPSLTAGAERSSTLLQTKLFGAVKKAGIDRTAPAGKRRRSFGEPGMVTKKTKLGEGVGLGIGV